LLVGTDYTVVITVGNTNLSVSSKKTELSVEYASVCFRHKALRRSFSVL